MIWPIACIVVGVSAGPGQDWEPVESVRAAGYERIAEGIPHPFTIARTRDALVYSFAKDIDGQLAGIMRTEVAGSDGVYTWIASNPQMVLQLPALSAPEFAEAVWPVKFGRSQLFNQTRKLSKDLGKRIEFKGKDSVATRDCEVVALSDRTPLVQSLWLDKTGLPLKEEDRIGRDLSYERLLTAVQTNEPLPPSIFTAPPDAIVIHGLVSPSILTASPKSGLQFETDLRQIRTTSHVEHGGWIQDVVTPMGFAYMGTSRFQSEPLETEPAYQNSPPPATQNTRAAFGSFSGVPSAWAVPGQVAISGGTIYFGFKAPPNEGSRDLSQQLYGSSQYSPSQQVVPSRGYVSFDGSIVRTPDTQDQTPTTQKQTRDTGTAGEELVRSEFLNTRTGDTITFLQMHNVSLAAVLKGLKLSNLKTIGSARFGEMQSYEVARPFTLHVLLWRSGDSQYALVSNILTADQLQNLAERSGV